MSSERMDLATFSEFQGSLDGIEFANAINLPSYAPAEAIDVHIGRLATIAKFGRLCSLRIGTYSESSQVSVAINGINADGSATASNVATKTDHRSSSELSNPYEDGSKFPRGVATIKINTGHDDLSHANVRQPQPWADLIAQGLRAGLIESTKNQLLKPVDKRRSTLIIDQTAILTCIATLSVFEHDPIRLALNYAVVQSGYLFLPTKLLQGKERTAFTGFPVDRLAIAAILARQRITSVNTK